jgi:predicted HAD superfamily Cof-like phosphohydrolase
LIKNDFDLLRIYVNLINIMSLTNFLRVKEFHDVFEHPFRTSFENDLFTTNPKLFALRKSLILEEAGELKDAVEQQNFVEVADALSDLLYVLYGAGLALGFDLDHLFGLVYHKEPFLLEKNKLTNFQIVRHTSDYESETLTPFLTIFKDEPKLVLSALDVLSNKTKELTTAIEEQNQNKLCCALLSLLHVTYETGLIFGIDLDVSFDLVHKSNMTKACKTEQEALDTVEQIVKDGRYKNPKYKLSRDGKYWLVYDGDNNKTLKSKYYSPVDLKYLLG